MRLLVIDLHNTGGHYPAYCRAVYCEAKRRRWQVVSAMTAEAQLHSSYSGLRDILEDGCELVTASGVSCLRFHSRALRWLEAQVAVFFAIRSAFKQACRLGRPDVAYIVDCDSWYPIASLLGSPTPTVPFVTVALGVRYHHKQLGMITSDLSKISGHIQRVFFERFMGSSGLGYVLTPDEALSKCYQQRVQARLRYIPDIADLPSLIDKCEARRELGLIESAQVLLSYGGLSKRKGIQQLLDVLSDERCPPSVVALIAGEADPQTTALLHSEAAETLRTRGRLHWLGGFLDDTGTKLVFSAADVAWLGYRDFYKSSGFLWQASLAGLPIIGCRDGLIGHLVDRHELGLTVDPNDHNEVLSAVDALMNDHRRRCQIVANCLEQGAKHVSSQFGATVCDALASCAPVVEAGLGS